MYTLELGTFMYRYSINVLPSSFTNYFTKRSDIQLFDKAWKQFKSHQNKKTFSDHSVRTSGPRLWNALENSLKTLKSVKHFRKYFKKKLISNYD